MLDRQAGNARILASLMFTWTGAEVFEVILSAYETAKKFDPFSEEGVRDVGTS